jgi:hypothetical protein
MTSGADASKQTSADQLQFLQIPNKDLPRVRAALAELVGYPLCFDRFGPLCDKSLHIGT